MKISIAIIILFQLIVNDGLAQGSEVKFNLVEGNNSAALGRINAITQHSNGYMWFSGQENGYLYKYDGVRMIAYKPDILFPNSTSFQNRMQTVYADPSGMIWIGFFDGIEEFNPVTGIFKVYKHDSRRCWCCARRFFDMNEYFCAHQQPIGLLPLDNLLFAVVGVTQSRLTIY